MSFIFQKFWNYVKLLLLLEDNFNHAKVPQSFAMFYEEWTKTTVLSEFHV